MTSDGFEEAGSKGPGALGKTEEDSPANSGGPEREPRAPSPRGLSLEKPDFPGSGKGGSFFKKRASDFKRGKYRTLMLASSVGLSVVIAILLGLGLGVYLDRRLGTLPWLTIAGLVVGVVAGFRNLFVMSARVERAQKEEEADER